MQHPNVLRPTLFWQRALEVVEIFCWVILTTNAHSDPIWVCCRAKEAEERVL
jgi:hypothetical protein